VPLHLASSRWQRKSLRRSLGADGGHGTRGRLRGRWRRHGSFRGAKWAFFLRNHDELDLGNLSEEERQAVFAELAPEPSMQLYGRGIRRRLAPMLGDRRRLELAYSLLLSLPGTPVLRYGEEIGMGENAAKGALRPAHADAVDVRPQRRSTAERPVRPPG